MSPLSALPLLLLPLGALGHGTMLSPTPRQPEPIYWYQVGCMAGCTCTGGGKDTYPSPGSVNCTNPLSPTLKDADRTWNVAADSPRGDWNQNMPFRAPGTSVPLDPCGIASGFDPDAAVQFPHTFSAKSNVQQGQKGSELPKGKVTLWEAGATVQASFTLIVNHGGGYQYRVCKTDDGAKLTNDCFEGSPLKFANSKQTVQFSDKLLAAVSIEATDVTEGVVPAGAAWRRLPLPACNCDLGQGCTMSPSSSESDEDDYKSSTTAYGMETAHGECLTGLQFSAPHLATAWPEGYGYFVAELTGSVQGKGSNDKCGQTTTEAACTGLSGCLWYADGNKRVCYSSGAKKDDGVSVDTSSEDKDTSTAGNKCSEHTAEGACTDVGGCAWYIDNMGRKGGDKCYAVAGNGKDDDESSRAQWSIEDALIAPTELGEYVLQWRWDNEQTPQIWTSCADIKVVDELNGCHRHGGGVVAAAVAVAAAAFVSLFN